MAKNRKKKRQLKKRRQARAQAVNKAAQKSSTIINLSTRNVTEVRREETMVDPKMEAAAQQSREVILNNLSSVSMSLSSINNSLSSLGLLFNEMLDDKKDDARAAEYAAEEEAMEGKKVPDATRITDPKPEDKEGIGSILKTLLLSPAMIAAFSGLVYSILPKETKEKITNWFGGFFTGLLGLEKETGEESKLGQTLSSISENIENVFGKKPLQLLNDNIGIISALIIASKTMFRRMSGLKKAGALAALAGGMLTYDKLKETTDQITDEDLSDEDYVPDEGDDADTDSELAKTEADIKKIENEIEGQDMTGAKELGFDESTDAQVEQKEPTTPPAPAATPAPKPDIRPNVEAPKTESSKDFEPKEGRSYTKQKSDGDKKDNSPGTGDENVSYQKGKPNEIPINSRYGMRKTKSGTSLHAGVDFLSPKGTPITMLVPGIVKRAQAQTGYGRTIDVEVGKNDVLRFAHLDNYNVKAGDVVQPGQVIGRTGASGKSKGGEIENDAYGAHLHFEHRPKSDFGKENTYNPLKTGAPGLFSFGDQSAATTLSDSQSYSAFAGEVEGLDSSRSNMGNLIASASESVDSAGMGGRTTVANIDNSQKIDSKAEQKQDIPLLSTMANRGSLDDDVRHTS